MPSLLQNEPTPRSRRAELTAAGGITTTSGRRRAKGALAGKSRALPLPQWPVYIAAARSVMMRLVAIRWIATLEATAPAIIGGALGALLLWRTALRGYAPSAEIIAAVMFTLGWILGTGLFCWLRRPDYVQSLATWDNRANLKETLVSAYDFAARGEHSAAIALHLTRADNTLYDALPKLSGVFPMPLPVRSVLAVLILTVLAATGLGRIPTPPGLESLSAEERARAARLAEEAKKRADDMKAPPFLTPEEMKKFEEMKKVLGDAAEAMKGTQTPREVLEALERRARQADELAKSLGKGDDSKLSNKMLDEMDRHADTAPLSAQLRAQDLNKAAEESEKLADKLKDDALKLEERKRIENALNEALKAAEAEDKQKAPGEAVEKASGDLHENKPKDAGERFSDLAKKLQRQEERKQAEQQLQDLARDLRSAGQEIFGGEAGDLKSLPNSSETDPSDSQQGNDKQQQQNSGDESNSNAPRALSQRPLRLDDPGDQNPSNSGKRPQPRNGDQDQQDQNDQNSNPIPGAGMMREKDPNEGEDDGDKQKGMAIAPPVPGSEGGDPAFMMPGGNGGAPIPGMEGGMPGGSSSIPGGSRPGTGSAGYGTDTTKATEASGTVTVNAAHNDQGASYSRSIQGAGGNNHTARNKTEAARQELQKEEEALTDEPLPAARRDQVLRYFKSLRENLAK
ncbi:hypothetical protein DB346_14355 [Verrucomicrobia bacterium LW23]|nr:hypothetical protein DB346_14355 [Verrucomicrobia bacterium LW23]